MYIYIYTYTYIYIYIYIYIYRYIDRLGTPNLEPMCAYIYIYTCQDHQGVRGNSASDQEQSDVLVIDPPEGWQKGSGAGMFFMGIVVISPRIYYVYTMINLCVY